MAFQSERPAPRSAEREIIKPCETGFDLNPSIRASALNLRSVAHVLSGDVVSGGVNFPGLGHPRHDRSARLRLDPTKPGGYWVDSWCGDDWKPIREYVDNQLGVDRKLPIRERARPTRRDNRDDDKARTRRALETWEEARDPWGTPVEAYLMRPGEENGRAVELLPEAAGVTIRYHPECSFGKKRTSAMVCLVRDIRTNEPKAIHRTALSLDGRKIEIDGEDKLSWGPTAGGAIKLTPDEDVTICLGVAEGVETALSLRHIPKFGPSPVWSLISAGNLGKLPVLPGIESLWIAVDNDKNGTGQRAARKCAYLWQAAGAEVFLKTPCEPGTDLNDLLTGGHNA